MRFDPERISPDAVETMSGECISMTGVQENEMSTTLACGDAASQDRGLAAEEGQPLTLTAASQEIAVAVGITLAAPPAKRSFRLYPEWAQRGPFW